MSEFKEYTEVQEFTETTLPDPAVPPASTEWDGWGDEADQAQFEARQRLASPLGAIADRQAFQHDRDDGWGVSPTAKR